MHEKVDIPEIISRTKHITALPNNKDIAALLGLSATDFGNRKKRGTLLPLLIDWAVNESVDLNFLILGKENNKSIHDEDPEVTELLEGARRVLKSDNPIAFDALERNIRYFDHAVATEKRLEQTEDRLRKMENNMNEILAALKTSSKCETATEKEEHTEKKAI